MTDIDPWNEHVRRTSLRGKVALVTGAAQGIGLAIAQSLVGAGCSVVLADRDTAVEARAEELRSMGGTAQAVVGDVTGTDGAARLFGAVEAGPGRLDILVNNAAILRTGSAARMDRPTWQEVIDTNLSACFFMAQAAAVRMQRPAGGCIINMSSIVGRTARTGLSAYIAAKSGIDGLTRALALDFAGIGIRVNAIAPGFITTEMSRTDSAAFDQYVIGAVPAHRWGAAADIGAVAVFLASEAAAYVNGQTIYVDGGFTAGVL